MNLNWRLKMLPAIAKYCSPLYMFAGHWCGAGDWWVWTDQETGREMETLTSPTRRPGPGCHNCLWQAPRHYLRNQKLLPKIKEFKHYKYNSLSQFLTATLGRGSEQWDVGCEDVMTVCNCYCVYLSDQGNGNHLDTNNYIWVPAITGDRGPLPTHREQR